MIEVLKEFLLFGVIEVFILLMFYKYVGKIDKVKYWHGFVLSPLFFIIGLIQFPYVKQIGMIVIMIAYLYVISKKLNIKVVVFGAIYLLVVETIFCMFYDFILLLDLRTISIYSRFLYMIPIRLLEVGLIILYRRRNCTWAGCGMDKRLLKKKKK